MSRVETVNGSISPDKLGITLMHEHALIDQMCNFRMPTKASMLSLVEAPVSIDILGILRRDPSICKDNGRLIDLDDAINELAWLKSSGGKTIVDQTVEGIGRDPIALRKISRLTDLNIIATTGWYLQKSHPKYIKNMEIEELSDLMIKDLEEEIKNTGIKAGGIGEIGCSDPPPFHEDEKKIVKAAIRTQSQVGCSFTFHPSLFHPETGKIGDFGEVYIDLIEKGNADPKKFYLSHSDGACRDTAHQLRLLDRGINLSYDCFGFEGTVFGEIESGYSGPREATDWERIYSLVDLCSRGYDKQIVLAQDVCYKMNLKKYGGLGYNHILENIIPILKYEGITQKQIDNMLIHNPKRILSY